MRKYGYRRKLLIGAVAAIGSLSIGCGDTSHRNSDIVPAFMTVEEFASDHDTKIGDAVILEGILVEVTNNEYYLGTAMRNVDDRKISEFQVALRFESDNVDIERMSRCLSDPVLVTGILQGSNVISVKYVKLSSDARVHLPDDCYHHTD